MSTCLALVSSGARQGRPKRKIDELEEATEASQPNTIDQKQSVRKLGAEDFERIKLSAVRHP